jgi:hypothetical protein
VILALILLYFVVFFIWVESPPRQIDLGSVQPAALIASPLPTPDWIRSITPPVGTVLDADEEVRVCLEGTRLGAWPRPHVGMYLNGREIMDVHGYLVEGGDLRTRQDDYARSCFEVVVQPGNYILTYTQEFMFFERARYSWGYSAR